jgi:adenine phosphoribosyltransferase
MGAEIVAACFVIDLPDLGGRKKLEDLGVKVQTLIEFRRDTDRILWEKT